MTIRLIVANEPAFIIGTAEFKCEFSSRLLHFRGNRPGILAYGIHFFTILLVAYWMKASEASE